MTAGDVFDILLRSLSIPALVFANAFFVAAEFSLVMVRPTRVRELVDKGTPGARRLQKAISNPDRVIAATQVGITIASLGLGWLGEPVVARFLTWLFEQTAGIELSPAYAHSLGFGVAFACITFLHVVLGELVPKSIALQRPTQTGLKVASPLLVAELLLRPFIVVLNGMGNFIVRMLGFSPVPSHQRVHSADELKMIVAASLQGGALKPEQGDILRRALELPVRRVRDIMIPRERMVAVDIHTPQDVLLDVVSDQGYTRLPVYNGTLDKVVGLVHAKDLFTIVASKGLIILEDLVRDPYFVSPDLEVYEILRGFRSQRVHLAVVREASGRVVGLVTLEDVLEQLVGQIADEHDTMWGS
jgi:CBS domain containing-hemolysin-like protein